MHNLLSGLLIWQQACDHGKGAMVCGLPHTSVSSSMQQHGLKYTTKQYTIKQ